jgi:hypothetical protein
MILMCVASKVDKDRWEALCLDLDLAVEGGSLEEVRLTLNSSIATYVEDALKEEPSTRDALLHRRAPLWVRAAWLWPFIVRTLFGNKPDGHGPSIGYQVACPA